MKETQIALLTLLATAAPILSQEQPAQAEEITARIIGEIPDGTPTPTIPVPEFVVPAKDVLESTTHQLDDGSTVTINRIKPIDLPPPIDTDAPIPVGSIPQQFNTPRHQNTWKCTCRHRQSTGSERKRLRLSAAKT